MYINNAALLDKQINNYTILKVNKSENKNDRNKSFVSLNMDE